jgi:hypothetical protein
MMANGLVSQNEWAVLIKMKIENQAADLKTMRDVFYFHLSWLVLGKPKIYKGL